MEAYLEMRTVFSIQSLLLLHPHSIWGKRGVQERGRNRAGDLRQTPSGLQSLLEWPRLAEVFWDSELPYLPKTSGLVV